MKEIAAFSWPIEENFLKLFLIFLLLPEKDHLPESGFFA